MFMLGLGQNVNGSEPPVAPERAFGLLRSGVNVGAPSGPSPLKDQFGRKLPMRPCLTPAMERAQKADAIVKGAQSGAETPRPTLGAKIRCGTNQRRIFARIVASHGRMDCRATR